MDNTGLVLLLLETLEDQEVSLGLLVLDGRIIAPISFYGQRILSGANFAHELLPAVSFEVSAPVFLTFLGVHPDFEAAEMNVRKFAHTGDE